jgi:hypothetical protein
LKKKVTAHTNPIVTVFLFSGRPNPQWILTEEQTAVWMQLWNDAALTEHTVQLPLKLGYKGCRVQKNKHSYWLIYKSCVSFYKNNKVLSKSDPGRKLELFLHETADAETKKMLTEMKVID